MPDSESNPPRRGLSAASVLASLLNEKCILLDELHVRSVVARITEAARFQTEIIARIPVASDAGNEPSFVRVGAGTACIPIIGVLTKYPDWFDAWCGFCPTMPLLGQLAQAIADPEIKTVVLDIDTPGGFVNGTVEFADAVAAAIKRKPVVAVIRGMCCSGGYWIASQCSQIISRPESEVGNIGVYSVLADVSKFYSECGVSLTTVASGEFKGLGADGKVTETLIADTRRIITGLYQQFVGAVATGRKLAADAAVAVADGKSYLGPQAKQLGLIDQIASSFDAAIEAAAGSPAAAPQSSEKSMPQNSAGTAGTSAAAAAKKGDDATAPAKEDVHGTLNDTVTSANKHKDQARACLDCANTASGFEDDTMDLAKQAVSALRASADESKRAADALEAKMEAGDEQEGEESSAADGDTDDSGDEGGDDNARKGKGKPATATELLKAFGDDKGFCMDQLAINATMTQAFAAHSRHQAKQIKELNKKLEAASGQPPVGFDGTKPEAAAVPSTAGTATSAEDAAIIAKKEWAANRKVEADVDGTGRRPVGCREAYLDEATYVAVRKRELVAR